MTPDDRPTGTRRSLLRGVAAGGLGIATLALPRGAAASSITGPSAAAVAGSVTYAPGDVALLSWPATTTLSTVSPIQPQSATVHSDASASGLSGTLAPGPADRFISSTSSPWSAVNAADPSISWSDGSGSRWWWKNSAATVDPVTDPYLAYTITTGSRAVTLASLCFNGMLANVSGGPFDVSVRTSIGGYAIALRVITGLTADARNVVVNLRGLSPIPALTSVTFRLYPFNCTGYAGYAWFPSQDSRTALTDADEYDSRQGVSSASLIGTLAA